MKNILIVKTGAMGDVLRTTVIITGLLEKYKSAKITWFTSQIATPLLKNNHEIKLVTKIKELSKNNWDWIICLEEDKTLLKALSKLKFKKISGTYYFNGIKYTKDSRHWYDMSLISVYGKKKADELKKKNKKSYPEILYKILKLKWNKQKYLYNLPTKNSSYVNKIKKNISKTKILGLVIGSGSRWPMKALPEDKLINLIKSIPNNYEIIILQGPEEKVIGQKIKKTFPYLIFPKICSINEFAQIVNLCDTIITPDSLPMHIAIALNKKVIAYFTVTSAEEIEIYNGKKIKAKHKDYCTYIKENKKRPNITDKINIKEIICEL